MRAIVGIRTLAIPAQAAPIETPSAAFSSHDASVWQVEDEAVNGWGRDRYWRRHRHHHTDAGDVLAGILILGGVVAVAKAIDNSSQNRRDRDERYRDYPDRDYREAPRYRDYDDRYDRGDRSQRGIGGAVAQCVDEVERTERVESVDTAEREGSGWQVEGELRGGGRYACEVGADGRVRDIDLDRDDRVTRQDQAPDRNADDRYDDEYYAEARSRMEDNTPAVRAEEAEHEAGADDGSRTWERGEPDDRYETVEGSTYALAN